MKIKWNEYTWYSKLIAAILFIVVIPAWTFYIGRQYEKTIYTIKNVPVNFTQDTTTTTPKSTIASSTTQSGWNIYTNSTIGFSFEYPTYMHLDEGSADGRPKQFVVSLTKGSNPYFLYITYPAEKGLEQVEWRYTFKDSLLGGKKTRDSGWNSYPTNDGKDDITRDIILQEYPYMDIISEPTDEDVNMRITASYSQVIDSILATFKFNH